MQEKDDLPRSSQSHPGVSCHLLQGAAHVQPDLEEVCQCFDLNVSPEEMVFTSNTIGSSLSRAGGLVGWGWQEGGRADLNCFIGTTAQESDI